MTALLAELLGLDDTDGWSWRTQALCAEVGGDGWFPEKGNASVREAKAVCSVCPVQVQCLEYALTRGERFGIWGGLTERERRRVRTRPVSRPAKPIPHGTGAGYKAHKRRGEDACEACLIAIRRKVRAA